MTYQEINFHNNYQIIAKLLLEFHKKKPIASDKYIKALTEIYFYINSMHIENREIKLFNSNLKQEMRKQNAEFYDFKEFIDPAIINQNKNKNE